MPPKAYAYWEWCTDKGAFKPFGKDESMALEKQYRFFSHHNKGGDNVPAGCNVSSVTLAISGQSYTLDVKAMHQTNDSTGAVRAIRRVGAPKHQQQQQQQQGQANNATTTATTTTPTAPPTPTEHYAWQWKSKDHFVDYDPFISAKLEASFLKDDLVLDIGSIPISAHDTANVKIHFGYMHQENKESGVSRPIRRVHRTGAPPALFTAPPVTTPFNKDFEQKSDDSTGAPAPLAASAINTTSSAPSTPLNAPQRSPKLSGMKRARGE